MQMYEPIEPTMEDELCCKKIFCQELESETIYSVKELENLAESLKRTYEVEMMNLGQIIDGFPSWYVYNKKSSYCTEDYCSAETELRLEFQIILNDKSREAARLRNAERKATHERKLAEYHVYKDEKEENNRDKTREHRRRLFEELKKEFGNV